MMPVLLASCSEPPVEPADDPRLARALRNKGCPVSIRPWTDIDPSDLAPGSAVVLRSTWDYHRHADRFLRWLSALGAAGATVLNPPELVRLTIDKSYLAADRPFGCAAPVTVRIPADAAAILREVRTRNWSRFILKPPVSASADGIFLLDADDSTSLRAALEAQPAHVLVQEFLPEIRDGELSLVFFGGWYSHAVRKTPSPDEFRVQEEFGSRTERVRLPAPVIAAASRVLKHLPQRPCYARIDGILRGEEFVLMEVELIEPDLFLRYMPGAADVFADVIVRQLAERRP
ncbi:MAG: RimK family alpha-L-glutamate ligase [Alphaproteobacteria bacterium]